MKKHLFKLSAFILSLCTAICSIPLTLAAAGDSLESEEVDPLPAEDESSADENVPFIVGEDDELRAESVKHFRLSDGSYLMVDYGTPVHYESDGDWLDIDNTLVSRDGRYENAQGESKVSFSADEYSDELYTLESGGHRLTLGAASQDALPASRPSEPAAELPTAVTSEAADTVSDGTASDVAEADVAADDSVSDAASLQTGEAIDENAAVSGAESTAEPSAVSDSYDDSETPAVPDSSDGDAVTAEPAQRGTKREIVLGGFDSERSAESDETQTAEYSAALSEARSTALTVSEYIDENPYATEEELSEVREEQNGKNMRQRAEIIGSVRNQDKIGYRGVFDGAALEYTLGGGMVKEDIIIAERADSYVYSFELDTALTLERDGDGLVLRDGEQTVFVLPAPYMTDAAGSRSDAVSYSFERREGGYTLTVTADGRWIDSDERVFPVTVDPTVSTSPSSKTAVTTDYIYDNDTETEHTTDAFNFMGRSTTQGTYYNYIKFNEVPDVPYNHRVIGARIYIYASSGPTGSSVSEFNFLIQKALPDWRTQITASAVNPNPILDYHTFYTSRLPCTFSLDISGALDNLGSSGTGFFIYPRLTDGEQMSNSAHACLAVLGGQSGGPVLALHYRNIMGTESYYTTRSASAGRAGAAYIGDYSGNLVLERTLASEVGVDISYIYNSRYGDWVLDSTADVFHTVDYSNMRSAAGWRLNIQQSIVSKTVSLGGESKEYLIYSDADGTEHWFVQDGDSWKDEDGLNFTATRDNNVIVIKNDKDNKIVFLNGYLWYTEDSNGNKTVLLYDSTTYGVNDSYPKASTAGGKNKLVRVIYVAADGTILTVANFEYTDAVLTAVVDRSGRRVTLSQSTSDMLLTKITDPDGKSAIYRYREFPYRISAAYDTETSFGLAFTYYLENDDYLTSYTSFYSTNIYNDSARTKLSEVGISRSVGNVMYTDKGHDFSKTTDDIITTVSFDTLGRTVSTRSVDSDSILLSSAGAGYTANVGTSAKNNKLTLEGAAGAVSQNILVNGGFENGSYWMFEGAASYSTDTAYTGSRSVKLSTVSNTASSNAYNLQMLSEGTYSLSGRVKVTAASKTSDKVGARISVVETNGNVLAESIYVNKVTSESVDGGWMLLHCSFDAKAGVGLRICVTFSGIAGTAYFDNIMLQKGDAISNFNLLDNSGFSVGLTSWVKSGTTSADIVVKNVSDGVSGKPDMVLCVPSAPHKTAGAYQTVNLNIPGTETFMLSAFAKACSAPLDGDDDDSIFELGAILTYSDGTTDTFKQSFNPRLFDSWQHVAVPIVPRRPKLTIKTARIYVRYDYNLNTAYFDNFALTLDGAQCYTYDDDGNVVAVNRTNTDEISNIYSGGNLISSTGGANGMFEYEYDSKHNVTKVKTSDLTMSLSYDANGNAISSRLEGGGKYMSTSATYVDGGTKVGTVTDNAGVKMVNTYVTNTDLLKRTRTEASNTNPGNALLTKKYTYDSADRISGMSDGIGAVAYSYKSGNLSKIERSKDGDSSVSQAYTFTYNKYGQRLSVKTGENTLATYTYNDTTHNLEYMTYGNNQKMHYGYDKLDRMTFKEYTWDDAYTYYSYDYLGNVIEEHYSCLDVEDRSYHYEYDRLGRLVRSYISENGVIVGQSEQEYDSKGRDSKYSYVSDDLSYGNSYRYYDESGRLGSADQYYNGNRENTNVISYANLGRVRFRIYAGDYSGRISYTYQTYNDDTDRVLSNMTSMRYTFNGVLTFADYTYDNIGNIKSSKYTYDDKVYSEAAYVYDNNNRLIAENCTNSNIGFKPFMASYTYDSFGNIIEAERPDSSGTNVKYTYSYDNAAWRDLLTAYNGHAITYDEIGNPISYYNGRNYGFTWEMGRQMLSSAVDSKNIYYDYNKDGIRIEKKVSGKYTDRYIVDGAKVIGMERTKNGSSVKDVYHFIYDEMGNIWSAICYVGGSTEPVRYYYKTNAQGDVKQIVDSDYNVIAYYAYDAWGRPLAILDGNDAQITDASHFAIVNPFRYRGYIYDNETGFYYLRSRYYDPEIGRFINADGYVTTDIEPIAMNMFAYCCNNPVRYYDPNGACIITYPCGGDDYWDCDTPYNGSGHILECMVKQSQLQEMGFHDTTIQNTVDLNLTLWKNDITTSEQIVAFLAQCAAETSYGLNLTELGSEEYFNSKSYGMKYRGAGYIQVTGRSNYEAFANYVGDMKILELGAEYVAANYAWDASGWWWTENNMNALINSGGTVREITFRVRRNEEGWKDRQIIHDRIRAILG